MIVAVIDVSACMKICRKDVGIFVDGPVLYDGLAAVADLPHLVEPAVEKVDLQVKRPACHVVIEIPQVGVVVDGLEKRRPAIVPGQFISQGAFAGPDVP